VVGAAIGTGCYRGRESNLSFVYRAGFSPVGAKGAESRSSKDTVGAKRAESALQQSDIALAGPPLLFGLPPPAPHAVRAEFGTRSNLLQPCLLIS